MRETCLTTLKVGLGFGGLFLVFRASHKTWHPPNVQSAIEPFQFGTPYGLMTIERAGLLGTQS